MEWDFNENSVVTDVNAVPEQFRGYYEEGEDGKFNLSESIRPLAEAYSGVSKRAKKLETEKSQANKQAADRRGELDTFKSLVDELGLEVPDGIDPKDTPAVIRTAFEDLTNRVKNGKDIKVNMEKVQQEADRKIAQVTEQAEQRVAQMQSSLQEYMVGRDAATALAEAGVVEKGTALLMPQIMRDARVLQDEDGKFVVRIVDENGDARSNGRGGFMSVADRVTELKGEYPIAFKSETPAGTGTPPRSQQKAAPRQGEEKSSVQKISAGLGSLRR